VQEHVVERGCSQGEAFHRQTGVGERNGTGLMADAP
jgi:hypothetical protein